MFGQSKTVKDWMGPCRHAYSNDWSMICRPKSLKCLGEWLPVEIQASEKPAIFYDMVSRATIGPRLDMFGRRKIDYFDSWGFEAPDISDGSPSGQSDPEAS